MLSVKAKQAGRRWRLRLSTSRMSRRRHRRRSRSKLAQFVCTLYRLLLDPCSHPQCAAQCPKHVTTLLLRLQHMHTETALWFMHWLTSALPHGLQIYLRGADRGGADSPPRPTPTTPNGTPLPRGPPPARPLHEVHRGMSLALSNAIGQTFLEQGGYLREVLTLLPGQWEYLNAVTVQIRPLTPTDSFHPNVLSFEEEDQGHVDETAEGATEHGEGHHDSGTGSRSGRASSSRNPEPSATAPWTLSVAYAKPKNRKPRTYCSACLPLITFVVKPQPVPNLPAGTE